MKLFNLGKNYENWKEENYPNVKEETKIFLENLFDKKRETKLWKHQAEAILKLIYSYEILEKNTFFLYDEIKKRENKFEWKKYNFNIILERQICQPFTKNYFRDK